MTTHNHERGELYENTDGGYYTVVGYIEDGCVKSYDIHDDGGVDGLRTSVGEFEDMAEYGGLEFVGNARHDTDIAAAPARRIVFDADACREAYDLGYAEFAGVELSEDWKERGLSTGYTDGARYYGVVSPELHAIAGHGDNGNGSYQEGRDILLILGSSYITYNSVEYFNHEIVDEFWSGAYDAAEETGNVVFGQ